MDKLPGKIKISLIAGYGSLNDLLTSQGYSLLNSIDGKSEKIHENIKRVSEYLVGQYGKKQYDIVILPRILAFHPHTENIPEEDSVHCVYIKSKK